MTAELFGGSWAMPFGIEVSGDDVFVATINDHRVWQLDSKGTETSRLCIAGSGEQGFSGDGGPATDAQMNWPHEVRVDAKGNVYIADTRNNAIRCVDAATGNMRTLKCQLQNDGLVDFPLNQPHSIDVDGEGYLLIADTLSHRVLRLDVLTGQVNLVSGTGTKALPVDGGNALDSTLSGPRAVVVDENQIWLALREGNSLWRIDRTSGTIHHVAGTGKAGFSGDGGDPKLATFRGPKGLAVTKTGDVVIVDTENNVLRVYSPSSNQLSTPILTIDGQPVTMRRPHGIAVTDSGDWLVSDSENDRILRVHAAP